MSQTGQIISVEPSSISKPKNREDWQIFYNGRQYPVVKVTLKDTTKGLFTLPASQGAFGITVKCDHPEIIKLASQFEEEYREANKLLQSIETQVKKGGLSKVAKNAAIGAVNSIPVDRIAPREFRRRIDWILLNLENRKMSKSVNKENIKSVEK
jgi:hypothetical protein